jgi:predicted peptidase
MNYDAVIGDASTVEEINFHYLGAPDFGDEKYIKPKRITAFGEVLEDGLVISCVRIEYSAVIEAGLLKPVLFQVPGRKVIRTYVNEAGKRGEVARKGQFLFLELLTNPLPDSNEYREALGTFRYQKNGQDWALELPLVVSVKQLGTVFIADGRAILPFNRPNDDQYIELVDELQQATYTAEQSGVVIRYNLFVPPGYEARKATLRDLPLVLFFHGAGEAGFDNRSPVTAYAEALEFCRVEAQRENPCFVMFPQCPVTAERDAGLFEEYGWLTYLKDKKDGVQYTHPSKPLKAAVNALLHQVIPGYNIDKSRIYTAGHSNGAGGALMALIEKPDVFAAALSFSTAAVLMPEMIEKIKDKPIFFTMAEDDEWDIIRNNMPRLVEKLETAGARVVRCTGDGAWDGSLRGAEAQKQVEFVAERMKGTKGAKIIYAEYIAGSIVPTGHLSHRASCANAGIRRWLFEQKTGAALITHVTHRRR